MSDILTRKPREYVDVDFLFKKHPITDNVSVKKSVNAIKQSVINLLTLREYDKPFHPEIASPVYPLLFDNFTVITEIILEDELKKYLNLYEPRINITSVRVSMTNPNYIDCTIIGVILNTEEPFTVNVLVDRLR